MTQRIILNMRGLPNVAPGTLPARLLDQTDQWVTPEGYFVQIEDLTIEDLEFVIDYLLAHAKRLRAGWAIELHQSYDTQQRPRRWMLERPVMREFMRRYVAEADLRDKYNIESAFEEANDR